MVAAALVLLCTKPLEVALFSHAPWLITLPSIAIIGREVINDSCLRMIHALEWFVIFKKICN